MGTSTFRIEIKMASFNAWMNLLIHFGVENALAGFAKLT